MTDEDEEIARLRAALGPGHFRCDLCRGEDQGVERRVLTISSNSAKVHRMAFANVRCCFDCYRAIESTVPNRIAAGGLLVVSVLAVLPLLSWGPWAAAGGFALGLAGVFFFSRRIGRTLNRRLSPGVSQQLRDMDLFPASGWGLFQSLAFHVGPLPPGIRARDLVPRESRPTLS